MVDKQKNNTVIFFAPVKKEYFLRWEYYQVDVEMLEQCFDKVIICHSALSFIKAVVFCKISAVYCWWWHQSVFCVLFSRLLQIPVYVTGAVHMYDESGAPDFFSKSLLYRLCCRISWRFASKNLFISKSQYRQIHSHEKVNNPRLLKSSLGPSFQVPKVETIPVSENVNSDLLVRKIRMLTVVWMTKNQIKRKSVYEILEALSLLIDDGITDFEWVIAGGDSDGRKELETTISKLGLDPYVTLTVDVSHEQKQELFKNSDLYIQPSYYEGFGNAVLEAMSYGNVAIISRNAAQAEVVGKAGFIVEEIDKKCIADAVIQYLQLSLDERINLKKAVVRTVLERHLFKYRVDEFKKIISEENS